jgi:hypothetical protein
MLGWSRNLEGNEQSLEYSLDATLNLTKVPHPPRRVNVVQQRRIGMKSPCYLSTPLAAIDMWHSLLSFPPNFRQYSSSCNPFFGRPPRSRSSLCTCRDAELLSSLSYATRFLKLVPQSTAAICERYLEDLPSSLGV